MGMQNPAGIAAMAKTAAKAGHPLQYGALVYRINNDKTQVMLITSRRSQRWILPKGWPIKGLKPHQAAAQEAWEEAGIRGKVSKRPCGLYTYPKELPGGKIAPCTVILFPLEARKSLAVSPKSASVGANGSHQRRPPRASPIAIWRASSKNSMSGCCDSPA